MPPAAPICSTGWWRPHDRSRPPSGRVPGGRRLGAGRGSTPCRATPRRGAISGWPIGAAAAMLMDAPPPEDVGRFVRIARLLCTASTIRRPLILAADPAAGFLVLGGSGRPDLYPPDRGRRRRGSALTVWRPICWPICIAASIRRRRMACRPIPTRSLLEEAGRFVLWFLPAATGAAVPEPVAAEFFALWRRVLPLARAVPDKPGAARLSYRQSHAAGRARRAAGLRAARFPGRGDRPDRL
ncbi:MAG: hypothetical protein WDN69_04810 [Aliidongia sp.]